MCCGLGMFAYKVMIPYQYTIDAIFLRWLDADCGYSGLGSV